MEVNVPNPETAKPNPGERESNALCKAIVRLCRQKGYEVPATVMQGASNPYGAYIGLQELSAIQNKLINAVNNRSTQDGH